MLESPARQVGYMAVIVCVGFAVCMIGLQKGLERVTKVMMAALLVIMVVLAVNSILTPGGGEGLAFYLLPNMEEIRKAGLLNVIVAAMNQSFFTLSIGIGAMAIFGSYIGRDRALLGESVSVAVLDTFVAFTSGLIIFPACFAYGVQPDAGPSLIFITLPNIFNHMKLGRLWGALFFVFMTFAALSTVLAVFENILAMLRDLTGWTRKKAGVFGVISMFILSLPCALGFNVWKGFQPMGEGTGFMDLEDFLVSNLMLPAGALIYIIFCTQRFGWGWDAFVTEANSGRGMKIPAWFKPVCTWILPVLVAVIIVMGLV